MHSLDALGVTYQDFDSNGNQTTQNEAIQTAIADGYNLLIVNMVTSGSSDTAKGIMELAGDVPVIFFNRAVDEDGVEASASVLNAYENIAFVGTDAPEAGHLQGKMVGEYVLEHYVEIDLNGDGKISYAMFKGDEANVEAIYRTQYGVEDANAVLTAAGKPELVYFDATTLRLSGRPERPVVRCCSTRLHEHEPLAVQRGQQQHRSSSSSATTTTWLRAASPLWSPRATTTAPARPSRSSALTPPIPPRSSLPTAR